MDNNTNQQEPVNPKKGRKSPLRIVIGATGAVVAICFGALGITLYEIGRAQTAYGVMIDSNDWAVLSFNRSFDIYFGSKRRSSEILDLIDKVKDTEFSEHKVEIEGISSPEEVDLRKHYSVNGTQYDDEGYITVITITEDE